MQTGHDNKILFLCIILLLFAGCSINSVPKNYKKAITKFAKEAGKIEAIPLEKKRIGNDDGTYQGIISFEKRAEYFSNNREIWNEIFVDLENVKGTVKTTDWYDDILFCIAFGYLKCSTMDTSGVFVNKAISAISNFIDYNENSNIDEWTKKELKDVFWANMASYFDKTISEKKNINQFLYIARASLWKNKKKNTGKAIEDYYKALEINPDSLWGKEAKNHIQLLKK